MRTALTIRETKLRRRFCGVASAVAQHDVEQTFVETTFCKIPDKFIALLILAFKFHILSNLKQKKNNFLN